MLSDFFQRLPNDSGGQNCVNFIDFEVGFKFRVLELWLSLTGPAESLRSASVIFR